MKRIIGISIIALLGSALPAFADGGADTILVAGFQNRGLVADDNINIVLTKSLISYFSRSGSARTVAYDSVASLAARTGFWQAKSVDVSAVENMGLQAGVSKVLFGDYTVDEAKNLITVNYSVYDVRNGRILMMRSVEGAAGMDIFDTIDAISKKVIVAVLGREVDFAALPAEDVVTNTFTVTYHEKVQIMPIVVTSIGVAATVVGEYLNYRAYQSQMITYTNDYYLYEHSYAPAAYDELVNSYDTVKRTFIFQIALYSSTAILSGLDVYFILRKPELTSSFRWVAFPGYLGFSYGF